MKVVPKRIKSIRTGEIRVISFGEDAIAELLFENLMGNKEKYFSFTDRGDFICHMYWNRAKHIVTYAVQKLNDCAKNGEPNLKAIQCRYGITTSSLYEPNCYICLHMREKTD